MSASRNWSEKWQARQGKNSYAIRDQLLFSQGFQEDRDSEALLRSADHALFGICLFSACRIREACTLRVTDAYDASGRILPKLKIRKANTKGKLATRSIPIISDLRVLLTNYHPSVGQPYLFPGRFGGHFLPDSADKALRKACKQAGLIGVSTHSVPAYCPYPDVRQPCTTTSYPIYL